MESARSPPLRSPVTVPLLSLSMMSLPRPPLYVFTDRAAIYDDVGSPLTANVAGDRALVGDGVSCGTACHVAADQPEVRDGVRSCFATEGLPDSAAAVVEYGVVAIPSDNSLYHGAAVGNAVVAATCIDSINLRSGLDCDVVVARSPVQVHMFKVRPCDGFAAVGQRTR